LRQLVTCADLFQHLLTQPGVAHWPGQFEPWACHWGEAEGQMLAGEVHANAGACQALLDVGEQGCWRTSRCDWPACHTPVECCRIRMPYRAGVKMFGKVFVRLQVTQQVVLQFPLALPCAGGIKLRQGWDAECRRIAGGLPGGAIDLAAHLELVTGNMHC